jgi:hypothetical protein
VQQPRQRLVLSIAAALTLLTQNFLLAANPTEAQPKTQLRNESKPHFESNTPRKPQPLTTLSISGAHFLINDQPTFLLQFSYFGALGAPVEFIMRDLDDFQNRGFNSLRIWATWNSEANNISAVDENGDPREPFLERLLSLVVECNRRGLIVDVTLTRGKSASVSTPTGFLPNFAAHQRAVHTLVTVLHPHRNWYLDLANEHDVRDARFVPDNELKALREQVRHLDPQRLVTASFGGHDLTPDQIRENVEAIGLDFLCPHRPRSAQSAAETESVTTASLATMQKFGRIVPIHYQEPFRRGYGDWRPSSADFLADLRGAIAGGAAGWCFHNGSQKGSPDNQPRRSFDLHAKRLFDQLDLEERKFVETAQKELHAQSTTGK